MPELRRRVGFPAEPSGGGLVLRLVCREPYAAGELLGLRLLSLHNVRYLIRLSARARAAIVAGSFEGWSREWLARYQQAKERT